MARAYLFGGLATFGRLLAQSAEKGKPVRLIFAHFSTGENSGMPVVWVKTDEVDLSGIAPARDTGANALIW